MEGVETWLSSQAADFFDTGIHKRIPRYKCLSAEGDCVRSNLITYVFFLYNKIVPHCFVSSSPEATFRIALVSVYLHTILAAETHLGGAEGLTFVDVEDKKLPLIITIIMMQLI
jgi:hypothetical protein